MKTWKDHKVNKTTIKKELGHRKVKKDGKKVGSFYRKKHCKKFYYNLEDEEEKIEARKKAIDLIKIALWQEEYVTDFPKPTDEFLQLVNKLNLNELHTQINRFELINAISKNLKENTENLYYITPHMEEVEIIKQELEFELNSLIAGLKWKISNSLFSMFGLLLDDKDSNYRSGGHGRKRYVPKALERYIINRDNGKCQNCDKDPNNLRMDHIVPVTWGGPSTKWNLQVLCKNCNQEKLSFVSADELRLVTNRLQEYLK